MLQELSQKLAAMGISRNEILLGAVVLLIVAVLLKAVQSMLASRKKRRDATEKLPEIRLDDLTDEGPDMTADRLEFHHIPVRIAAIIVAPAGRMNRLPQSDELLYDLLDQVVPGLGHLAQQQQSPLFRYPTQLSANGFAHQLFRELALPNQGKRTVWAALAGMIVVEGTGLALGLVLRSAEPNGYGQEIAVAEGDWWRVLTVRHVG